MDKPSHNPNENGEATQKNSELALDHPANAASSELSEDQALTLLKRADVAASALTLLARNSSVMNSRKVLLALATHHRTPRHITIPLLRRVFSFLLLECGLTPSAVDGAKRLSE